jgi:predicted RNA-binding protein with PIN domain
MNIYFIDGYNVIHFCPRLQPLAQRDFEAARDSLIDRVARYCAQTGEPARIIFDGRGRKPEPTAPLRGAPGLEVVYSPGHLSADTVIERFVYGSKNRREIVVVTGDQGIRQLCRGLGSLVMAPEHFLDMIQENLNRARHTLRADAQRYRSSPLEDRLDDNAREQLNRLKRKLKNSTD